MTLSSIDRSGPRTFAEYVGQAPIIDNLKVFVTAARRRNEPLDHVLFCGPPGLGKTSLAYVIAREMGADVQVTSGPAIERKGDLAGILTNLKRGDVLFIDEIHRLNPAIEENLYPAMEDFVFDLVIGEGPGARNMKLPLQPFTLVGATTRTGLLTGPLRDRFRDRQPARVLHPRRVGAHRGPARRRILEHPTRPAGRRRVIARRAGGHRVSPTGCCDGSATSPRSTEMALRKTPRP